MNNGQIISLSLGAPSQRNKDFWEERMLNMELSMATFVHSFYWMDDIQPALTNKCHNLIRPNEKSVVCHDVQYVSKRLTVGYSGVR